MPRQPLIDGFDDQTCDPWLRQLFGPVAERKHCFLELAVDVDLAVHRKPLADSFSLEVGKNENGALSLLNHD